MKLVVLMTILAGFLSGGCWTTQGIPTSSDGDTDTDTDSDTDVDTDADSDTDSDSDTDEGPWGWVQLSHSVLAPGQYGSERLTLVAALFEEEVGSEDDPTHVAAMETEEGVPCDIFYLSEWTEYPDPPVQLDGGILWAGMEGGDGDDLSIWFEDGGYTQDYGIAGSEEYPMPQWFLDGEPFQIGGWGSGISPVFAEVVQMPEHTEFTSPDPDDGQVATNGDGDYVISWVPVESHPVKIVMGFNMDWDDSVFICFPPMGSGEMTIPHGWIEEYTWGGGSQLALEVREVVVADDNPFEVITSVIYQQNGDFGDYD